MCSFFTAKHPNKFRSGSDVTLMQISAILCEPVIVAFTLNTPSTGRSCLFAEMYRHLVGQNDSFRSFVQQSFEQKLSSGPVSTSKMNVFLFNWSGCTTELLVTAVFDMLNPLHTEYYVRVWVYLTPSAFPQTASASEYGNAH